MYALAFLAVAITILMETAEQMAFKYASKDAQRKVAWTIIGAACHIPHLLAWFFTLALLPLAIATPLLGAAYVAVPLAGQIFFKEKVDRRRWLGIGAIILGLILVSREIQL